MRLESTTGTGSAEDRVASLQGLASDVLPLWLEEIVQGEGRLTLSDYEAAKLLGLSRGSVRAAIRAGDIHTVRLGRRLLIPVVPLLEMVGVEARSDKAEEHGE